MGRKKALRRLAKSLRKLQSDPIPAGTGDIMGLIMIVMMAAAKSAREDLKALMDAVKKANRAKAGWRRFADCQQSLIDGVCADTAKVERKGMKLLDALERLAIDDLSGKLDGLSDMGEMESLRMQMAMDRHSKLLSTLSNLLKKQSETAQTIAQNIK